MIATMPSVVDVNGTLGWAVSDLNSTTAALNVTRDLKISTAGTSAMASHATGSFIDSINLATRTVNFLPVIMPEMEQVLQAAQTTMASSLPTSVNWSSSLSILDSTMMSRSLYYVVGERSSEAEPDHSGACSTHQCHWNIQR